MNPGRFGAKAQIEICGECHRLPAAGNFSPEVEVTLSSADAMTQSFNTSAQPSTTTDRTGIIVFENVPAGSVKVAAIPKATGRPSGIVSATVRADAGTNVLVYPTPL